MKNKRTAIEILLSLVDKVTGPLERVKCSLEQVGEFADRLRQKFDAIGAAGKHLTIVGGVMMGLLAFPINEAIGFEAGMVDVRKTTNLTFEEINAGISDLVDKGIPTSITGLQGIAAVAGQLGIKGKESIFSFTEEVAKIEAVSDLSAEGAASAFAAFANVFEIPIREIGNMGSAVNELSNNTNATAGFIVDALSRIGRPIQSLTYQDLTGLAATLADVGLGAERGGTAFRNVFTLMQTEAEKVAKVMGMSTKKWAEVVQSDGVGALTKLLIKLREMDDTARATTIKDLFGQQAFDAVNKLANKLPLLQNNMKMANQAYDENISLNKELEAVQGSAAGKITVLKNQFKLLNKEMGDPFLENVKTITGALAGLIRNLRVFAEVHPKITKIGLGFFGIAGAVLAVVGTVLLVIAAFGKLIAFILSGIGALGKLRTVMWAMHNWGKLLAFVLGRGLVKALGALGTALLGVGRAMLVFFLSPTGLVLLAIAAVIIGLYFLIKHWDAVKTAVGNACQRISEAVGNMRTRVRAKLDSVKESIKGWVLWFIKEGFYAGVRFVDKIIQGLVGLGDAMVRVIVNALISAVNVLPWVDMDLIPAPAHPATGGGRGLSTPGGMRRQGRRGGGRVGSINITVNSNGRTPTDHEMDVAMHRALNRAAWELG